MSRGNCSPEQMAECPLMTHFSDTHHILWPRSDYTTRVERQYRELPHHKVQLCRFEHNELHATNEPPTKPSHGEMVRAIASWALRELEAGA